MSFHGTVLRSFCRHPFRYKCSYELKVINKLLFRRFCTSKSALLCASSTGETEKKWESAVSKAEEIIGYPTSFMNLRFWLSDEMSNIAVNMRKLMGTKHPLMKTAKELLFDDKENLQTRGLLVLLMSKAGGSPVVPKIYQHHELDEDYSSSTDIHPVEGILKSQRSLAEVTEMIHTASVLHKCIIDIGQPLNVISGEVDIQKYLYGNKMALLSGDYLLAKASVGLASMHNTYVVEKMASAIADLMESRFHLEELGKFDILSESEAVKQWEHYVYKSGGCLYAKSCQSALMLAGHEDSLTADAFSYGRYFGLLQQLKSDSNYIRTRKEHTPSLFTVLRDKQIELIRDTYADQAIKALDRMSGGEAKEVLKSFIKAMSS